MDALEGASTLNVGGVGIGTKPGNRLSQYAIKDKPRLTIYFRLRSGDGAARTQIRSAADLPMIVGPLGV
jgi:hypothetical protein